MDIANSIEILELKELLQKVVEISIPIAEFIEEQLHKVIESDIEEKELNSLVSYVDKTAEIRLVEGLSKLLPDAGFITEEKTINKKNEALEWIIDPLDGTNNYLHKIPHFAISIALRKDNEIVLGVIYDVMRKEYYHATKNGGAYLGDHKIQVSNVDKVSKCVLGTGFPYSNQYDTKAMIDCLVHWLKHSRGVRRFGSAALDLAYVASGKFDAYYETSLNVWDVAAGILIVQEAGGMVSDYFGTDGCISGDHILASNGLLHEDVLKVLQKNFESVLS